MMLSVVLLSVVALAASHPDADEVLSFNEPYEREFWVFEWSREYDIASSECQKRGANLLTICSFEELEALRATGFHRKGHYEFWIALTTSALNSGRVPEDQFGTDSGDRCRVLSNYAGRPWTVYSKFCNVGKRWFLCEPGQARTCPEPTQAPTAAPTAPPTEPPTVPPTAPPTVPPTEPAKCAAEVEAFKANSLPVEPSFNGDSCKFLAKQCNAEKCFCVNPKNGERKYGNLEVPTGVDYNCAKKAKKCDLKLFKALFSESSYKPQCKNGKFLPKQCDDSGTCWCVKKSGKEIKKTRGADASVVC